MSSTMAVLGRSASYWTTVGVVTQTLWTSGAPVMTYPLYASEWHLGSITTAAIFAIFPIVVVVVLVVFGNISDFIGRRTTILGGLAASLCGVILFAVAQNVDYLFVGRAFMGFGVGLTAGAASAALVEFSSSKGVNSAGAITTAAQSLGFVLATLVGGALVKLAPWPTRLTFWVLCGYVVLLLVASLFLPETFAQQRTGKWKPRGLEIPNNMRRVFIAAALGAVISYVIGALLLSIGAQVTRDLIGSDNALVNGAALALFPIVSGTVSIIARGLPAKRALVAGGCLACTAMAFMLIAANDHSLWLFLPASAVAGVSFGLLFLGALTLINAGAPPAQRGGTLSALYLIAYLAQGLYALALGVLQRAWGLGTAVELGAVFIAILGLALAFLSKPLLTGELRS